MSQRISPELRLSEQALRLQYSVEHGINITDRIIRIDGDIDESMVSRIDSGMSEMERDSRRAITIRINSVGGSTHDALAIIGRMKSSPCWIITEGYGYVMSAASLILAAGDRRKASEFCWIMHHDISYGIDGTHREVTDYVAQVNREWQQWAECMYKFTGYKSIAYWKKLGTDKDMYFTSSEALDRGIIEEII